jgi:hypothetical protein
MYSVTPPVLYPNKCTSAFNRHVPIYVLYNSLQTFVDGELEDMRDTGSPFHIVSIHRTQPMWGGETHSSHQRILAAQSCTGLLSQST